MILPSRTIMLIVSAALERGQRVKMSVNGNSMLPFLRSGDLVELEPVDFPKRGDIVLVQTNLAGTEECYLLHRLVKVEGDSFYLRGDAQNYTEGPFQREAILGRLNLVWRDGKSRNLGGRYWRWVGLTWAFLSPISTILLQACLRLRRLGGQLLHWLQRIAIYRKLAKYFCPPYNIKEASQSDFAALWTGLAYEAEKDALEVTYLLARSKDKVLGWICLQRHLEDDLPYEGYWVYSLTVNHFYRGMGIGAELVLAAIKKASSEGSRELSAWVYENNRASLALFHKFGFQTFTLPELEEGYTAERERSETRKITLRKEINEKSRY